MMERQNSSIFGDYPYNKLGILPNAENLRLTGGPMNPLAHGLDSCDYSAPPRTSTTTTSVSVTNIDRLFTIVKDNTNSMVNLVIVVIVLVIENLVKGNLFTCPCEKPQNALYGAAFLSAPAAALLVVGIMANNNTWLLVTGCIYRQKNDYVKQHGSSCYHVMGVLAKALVAPLAWVIIGFVDGKFYECAASDDPCGAKDKLFLRSKSQVIGYIILMVSMFAAVLGLLLFRAFRPMSYEQDNYINTYRAMERLEIHRQFEHHAQAIARQNVQEFLAAESRPKRDWDYIANVPSLTPTGGPGGTNEPPSMSPLNKLVQRERRESMDKTAQEGPPNANGAFENRAVQTQESGEFVPLEDLKVQFPEA